MKTFCTLFILIFLMRQASAQSYIPFPEDSAEWCFEYGTGFDVAPFYTGLYKYFFEDDTVIQGVTYHNIGITRTWYGKFNYGEMPPLLYSNLTDTYLGKVGGLRTDGKKVYFYRYPGIESADGSWFAFYIPDTTDCLLYDFNLDSGDVFTIHTIPLGMTALLM